MSKKLNAFFVIALILFSMFPVQAAPPITYNKELSADTSLVGALFTDGDATGFYASWVGDNIQITSTNHYTDKTIKIKGTALTNRLKMYDGLKVGYTHIADDGTVTHEIKSLVIDNQGFAYLTADFSTVIISGMTGTTTTTYSSQSGNQSFSVPDGSSYDLNITNNQLGLWTATGGTITTNGTDNIHTFLSNGTFIPDSEFNVEVLVVAGGGAGGGSIGGGGGAGEVYYNADLAIAVGTHAITIGAGGVSSSTYPSTSAFDGTSTVFGSLKTSIGGGGGGGYGGLDYGGVGRAGACGGGRGGNNNGVGGAGSIGYDGGAGTTSVTLSAGGGGGMGAIGVDAAANTGGNGGTGVAYSISGSELYYGGGGGGATFAYSLTVGSGGSGVGGDGGMSPDEGADSPAATTGTANTGSGGGGGGGSDTGANGGSGIVIIRYDTSQGEVNITATIPGDSDTQSYNTSQSRAFTLTPTATTNNVVINTTSTDYDITITTYWTEDTTLQSETATAGYAKQYINYTPSSDITSADLNTTFDFVFADQDYIGTATSTLNDVSKPTARVGQDVNASVGSLTANTLYYWNVTVPYNNIFTLSNQLNYTSNLGVAVSFTDSDYSDPEGLAIDSRLWNFGDGNTSTASNPTHNYSSEGTYTANYTITETATISPQTITKEFNVIILPPVYTISGYVFDTNSNPLGLATVINNQTSETVYTDAHGYYILSDLYPGSILINATKSGYFDNSTISNIINTNLYNQNITMTAFEIYQLLLEIQEQLDVEDFDPTEGNYEMLSSTYNIFLVLLGACFVLSFPKRGEVTERDTGLNNVLFSFIGTILSMFLAQIIVSGQVVESFAFQSQIYDPLQHYLLYFVAIIMFVIFILNVLYYARQRWE